MEEQTRYILPQTDVRGIQHWSGEIFISLKDLRLWLLQAAVQNKDEGAKQILSMISNKLKEIDY